MNTFLYECLLYVVCVLCIDMPSRFYGHLVSLYSPLKHENWRLYLLVDKCLACDRL